MIFRAIMLSLALQTNEITKLALKKFAPKKYRNVDFSYTATDNIKNYHKKRQKR
jgi:hypothetical protein